MSFNVIENRAGRDTPSAKSGCSLSRGSTAGRISRQVYQGNRSICTRRAGRCVRAESNCFGDDVFVREAGAPEAIRNVVYFRNYYIADNGTNRIYHLVTVNHQLFHVFGCLHFQVRGDLIDQGKIVPSDLQFHTIFPPGDTRSY